MKYVLVVGAFIILIVLFALGTIGRAQDQDFIQVFPRPCQWERGVVTVGSHQASAPLVLDSSSDQFCGTTSFIFPPEHYREVRARRIHMEVDAGPWYVWPPTLFNVTEWLSSDQRGIFLGRYLTNLTQLQYDVDGAIYEHNSTGMMLEILNPGALLGGINSIRLCYIDYDHPDYYTKIRAIDIEYDVLPANC